MSDDGPPFENWEPELRRRMGELLDCFEQATDAGIDTMRIVFDELEARGVELPEFVRMLL